jgi:hypothetical protein
MTGHNKVASVGLEDVVWTSTAGFVAVGFMSASLGLQGIMGKRVNTQFATTGKLHSLYLGVTCTRSLNNTHQPCSGAHCRMVRACRRPQAVSAPASWDDSHPRPQDPRHLLARHGMLPRTGDSAIHNRRDHTRYCRRPTGCDCSLLVGCSICDARKGEDGYTKAD